MRDLSTKVASLALKHPVMNASGILGSEPEHMTILAKIGFSALVSKTFTVEPREGYSPPIIIELRNGGFLNAVGLANPGIRGIRPVVEKARELGLPVIVSVGGSVVNEFVMLVEEAENSGANAVELNLSCPHVKGHGLEIGQDPSLVYTVVKEVRSASRIPVFVKLGLSDRLLESAGKALEAGANAITLINTIRALAIDVYSLKPLLTNVYGGLSGPPIHPIAVRAVYDVYREYGADIIASGGVASWIDVAEFIVAGARAVQIGSYIAKNEQIVQEVLEGLRNWLEELNIRGLREVIGAAHRR